MTLFKVLPPLLEIKLDVIDFSAQRRGRAPIVIPPHNPVDFDLSFDGIDDYVDVGSGLSSIGDTTLETWAQPNCDGVDVFNSQPILITDYFYIYIRGPSNVVYFRYDNISSRTSQYVLGAGFRDLIHIIGSYEHANKRTTLYLNGSIVHTTSHPLIPSVNFTPKIGNFSTVYFNGKIGDTRSYNRVLSPTEVKQNYQENVTRTGLTHEWLFNKNAKDSAGANDGTVYGATYIPRKRYKA